MKHIFTLLALTLPTPTHAIAQDYTRPDMQELSNTLQLLNPQEVYTAEETPVTVTDTEFDDGCSEIERQVIELVNAERRRRGLPPYKISQRLMQSARNHASRMARSGRFRHSGSGFAENIAKGQRSPADVMRAWMKSPGHFRNIMNRNNTQIGIGVYRDKQGQLNWVQQFSR
jgi:uncharacterized protein YkwD